MLHKIFCFVGHSPSQIDGPTPTITCETCLNLNLTAMSHENNDHTAPPQSRDPAMLSTLQGSQHTPTLQNMVTQPGKYFLMFTGPHF